MNEFKGMNPKVFEVLYAAYIQRDGFFKHLDIIPDCAFLDIGAGHTLRASKYAVSKGATNVVAVDPAFEMNGNFWDYVGEIRRHADEITHFIFGYKWQSKIDFKKYPYFDLAVCQQGINYWFNEEIVRGIRSIMQDGGRFVFDTFNTKPSAIAVFKQYDIKGLVYGETTIRVEDTVHHWQTCEGYPPHYSVFKWISREDFLKILQPIFKQVDIITEERTDTYICQK